MKPNALLPNKQFIGKYPDVFRIWVNEYPRASGHIRKFFDQNIKHFLIQKFGIDIRDTNLKTDHLREVLVNNNNFETRLYDNCKL